jgi:hypothetical protein
MEGEKRREEDVPNVTERRVWTSGESVMATSAVGFGIKEEGLLTI